MDNTGFNNNLGRRDILGGRWAKRSDEARPAAEIASVLVQSRPERLDAAALAIEQLPGTQIYTRDPKGKLVVVIEAPSTGAIGAILNAISGMSDVLTAALVFQGTDGG